MSVWFAIPSKRAVSEMLPTLTSWREQGYKIALWRDWNDERIPDGVADLVRPGEYPGYAKAVNALVLEVLDIDPACEWVATGGDDVQPDMNHTAQQIARQCTDYFESISRMKDAYKVAELPMDAAAYQKANTFILDGKSLPYPRPSHTGATFGVMQATGDRWGHDRNTHTPQLTKDGRCSQCGHPKDHYRHMMGAYIDRVAGSPWMGREFCLRANHGKGPLWPGYYHMGCDEELQAVATRLGVFWQRPDLIHLHQHWGRGVGDAMGLTANMPDFLKRANSREEWAKYKELFLEREAAGFPGSEPL